MSIIDLKELARKAYLAYFVMRDVVDGLSYQREVYPFASLPPEEQGIWEIVVDIILRNYDEMKKDTK